MSERRIASIRRRDLLFVATASSVAAAIAPASVPLAAADTDTGNRRDKRRPQYQENSSEVQAFYRVNRYPVK
jgi:hypothetical protein